MHRSLALRIGTLVLVVFTTTAPAFAAKRDESSAGFLERITARVMQTVHHIIHPLDLIEGNIPK